MEMLASMTWGQWLVAMLIIVICSFLMLVIMLQRGRGGGLAGAFGGAGGSSAFGAKTGDVFTWITVVVAAVFIIVCVVANFVMEPPTDAQLLAADTAVAPPLTAEPLTTPAGGTDLAPTEVVPAGTPADSQLDQPSGDANDLPEKDAAPGGPDNSGGGGEDPSTP